MTTKTVNIKGIRRRFLLKALWYNIHHNGFVMGKPHVELYYNKEIALSSIQNGGYVDMVCGKYINCYVFGESDEINPCGYDNQWGVDAFKNVVDKIRREKRGLIKTTTNPQLLELE